MGLGGGSLPSPVQGGVWTPPHLVGGVRKLVTQTTQREGSGNDQNGGSDPPTGPHTEACPSPSPICAPPPPLVRNRDVSGLFFQVPTPPPPAPPLHLRSQGRAAQSFGFWL